MEAYAIVVRIEEMDAESRFLALLGMTGIVAGRAGSKSKAAGRSARSTPARGDALGLTGRRGLAGLGRARPRSWPCISSRGSGPGRAGYARRSGRLGCSCPSSTPPADADRNLAAVWRGGVQAGVGAARAVEIALS